MKIALIAAMDKEIELFKTYLDNFKEEKLYHYTIYTGNLYNHFIVLAKSGVGKVSSSMLTTTIILKFIPDLMINIGIAGGFDKSLKTLDTIIATSAAYSDVDLTTIDDIHYGQIENMPLFFKSDKELTEKIKSILTKDTYFGTILSGDQFVVDYDKCESLVNKYFKDDNVLGFDMESAAFLHVTNTFKVCSLVIRSVSDIIGSTKPLDYETFSHIASEKSCVACKKLIQNL